MISETQAQEQVLLLINGKGYTIQGDLFVGTSKSIKYCTTDQHFLSVYVRCKTVGLFWNYYMYIKSFHSFIC